MPYNNKNKEESAVGIETICRAPQAHATVKCEGSQKETNMSKVACGFVECAIRVHSPVTAQK